MDCPYCGYNKTAVMGTVKGLKNIRLRVCKKCNQTWKTEETPVVNLYMKEYLDYLYEIGEISKEKYELSIKKGE